MYVFFFFFSVNISGLGLRPGGWHFGNIATGDGWKLESLGKEKLKVRGCGPGRRIQNRYVLLQQTIGYLSTYIKLDINMCT